MRQSQSYDRLSAHGVALKYMNECITRIVKDAQYNHSKNNGHQQRMAISIDILYIDGPTPQFTVI